MSDNQNKQPGNQTPGPQRFGQMKRPQSITFWIVVLLLVAVFYTLWDGGKASIQEASYSQFLTLVDRGMVQKAVFSEKDVNFSTTEGKQHHTYLPFEDPELVKALQLKGVDVVSQKPSRWLGIFLSWFPFLLLIGFWIFMMRGVNNGQSKAFSFGKSKARLYEGNRPPITFKDVAGVDEAKEELQEIVEYLKDPKKFQRLGGRIPRGVLLVGRPGTGKTLLAKAVAGEAGVPFYSVSGSDFVEMFVGVGAARVRDLFEQAKKSAPCIAFIDEIDAVGRHRGTGLGGGHDEREQTLNQLLVEMDGFEMNDSVIIIAATNRPDILDPALLRPGRFDRQVTVDLPDIKGRYHILKVHSAKVPLGDNINLEVIARGTPGFSGADLANLVNEAALMAARKGKTALGMDDFEEAKDKIVLGKEKKSRVIADDEKLMTAYHEIGHVLCSIFQEKTEPVHKVTIIPRGFTGGATHYLQTDKSNYSRSYLEQMLVSLLGGRAAEEVIFGELTTGAGNDIERTTDIAKKMVCSWGMSRKLGPMTVGKEQGEVFLGKELNHRDFYSEETAHLVDTEIRAIVTDAHDKALAILTQQRELLEILSKELFEKETLNADEIFTMVLDHVEEPVSSTVRSKYAKAKEMRIQDPQEDFAKVEDTKDSVSESIPEPVEDPEPDDGDTKLV